MTNMLVTRNAKTSKSATGSLSILTTTSVPSLPHAPTSRKYPATLVSQVRKTVMCINVGFKVHVR